LILRNQLVKVNVQKKTTLAKTLQKVSIKKVEDFRLRLKRDNNQRHYLSLYFITDKNCYKRHLRDNWRNLNTDRILYYVTELFIVLGTIMIMVMFM